MIKPAIVSLDVASGGGGSSSLDCLFAQHEKSARLANLRAAMLGVPLSLLGLTASALLVNAAWRHATSGPGDGNGLHPLWNLTTSVLKTFVVWTAVFLPTLLTATLLHVPCISMQAIEPRKQWHAWDMQTECTDNHNFVSFIAVLGLLAAGPLTWLGLIKMSHAFPPKMLSFLVGGYKEGVTFWEVIVLTRRSVDTIIIVLMPLTYAAFSQTTATVALMATALMLHAYIQPYEDLMLNRLELANLFSNTMAASLTAYVSGDSWSQTPSMKAAAFATVVLLLVGTSIAMVVPLAASLRQR
ncbi:unnamed protein product [Prorocentrum cordatum]|uniref:Solute carrier family 40 protein n=1 Tax=Prorocentrum cordatum TaxID=2364126 RepID=A0ABN9VS70_9DINO|nr:unnamed protein product [Polarella glacialis]